MTFTIILTWKNDTETNFDVTLEGEEHKIMSTLIWITQGCLMASPAKRVTAYNEEGFDVLSYTK